MIYEGEEEYVYCAEQWEKALENATSAMQALRNIYPSFMWHLTETGGREIDTASQHLKEAIVDINRAGPHVLGRAQYEEFVEERHNKLIKREDNYD